MRRILLSAACRAKAQAWKTEASVWKGPDSNGLNSMKAIHSAVAHADKGFQFDDLIIHQSENSGRKLPPLEKLKFGECFTEHMFSVDYGHEQGWNAPVIRPFENISLPPGAPVLHYGLSCFEGMKAFCRADGTPLLFRPMMNMERLQRSTERLQLPSFDPEELLKCIKKLLLTDRSWLPEKKGYSMYLRPFAMGTTENLGVAASRDAQICVIMSPVGPYFPSGLVPVNIFLDERNVRAWPGGTGEFKVAGNYAPTIQPQVSAKLKHDCQQVLYTIPLNGQAYVSECGAMNMFFLLKAKDGSIELVTQPLDGTILPGITRDSALQICREWGEFKVSEREVSLLELMEASAESRVVEIFGTGTACTIQPVSKLVRANGNHIIPTADLSNESALTQRLFKRLTDIQYGIVESDWAEVVQ